MKSTIIKMAVFSAVAIMLIGSILMPVINDANTVTEKTMREGAQPFAFSYADGDYADAVITLTYDGGDTVQINDGTDTYDVPAVNATYLYLACKFNLAANTERELVIFIDDFGQGYKLAAKYSGSNKVCNGQLTLTVSNGSLAVTGTTTGGDPINLTVTPNWMAIPNTDGDYGIYRGTEPADDVANSIDVLSSTFYVAGLYDESTTTKTDGWHGILLAIPVILLAGLLVSVVATYRNKD